MARWIDTHWLVVWILAGDAFVHLEQVAITLFYNFATEALNSIGKVEIHAVFLWTNAKTFVDCALCCTR